MQDFYLLENLVDRKGFNDSHTHLLSEELILAFPHKLSYENYPYYLDSLRNESMGDSFPVVSSMSKK
jgi:hypothetical protein